ncbi:acyl-CoA synthetase FdrA [Rubrobacter aplysinae]|uniref:acyl-CoA synthetase FdrA n=1 Tax=Rubrobacter aplysinae TaxID=909625 RepID=UPI00064B98CE|nr:acyl-CoA synthetase FdrA [Rubrobacter aplysinae]
MVETRRDSYHDSVSLMNISSRLSGREGIGEAAAVMGTPQNIQILRDSGLDTPELEEVGPNDLVIAVAAESDEAGAEAFELAGELLASGGGGGEGDEEPRRQLNTTHQAAAEGANLALISTPGKFAAAEALKALGSGMHVHMFSDNVPLEREVELKELAEERGLLMMGPDCGTAIINGVPLAFANSVRRGNVGVIAASGTGCQEVTSLLHRLGSGVSQAIGTGGRDLSSAVGGRTTKAALRALIGDEETGIIVLVSKPPAREVAAEIFELAGRTDKPVVCCFLGADPEEIRRSGLRAAPTLEDAARQAAELDLGEAPSLAGGEGGEKESVPAPELGDGQRYLRGLYSGGTFCHEALLLLHDSLGGVYSNTPLDEEHRLPDAGESLEHSCIDLGEDEFTRDRPHPMIDFRLRNERIVREAEDPETAVILLDLVLGYGANEDPAGAILPAITRAREIAEEAGRSLPVVVSVCGTDQDPQHIESQERRLRQAGAFVTSSNARAVRLASALVPARQKVEESR